MTKLFPMLLCLFDGDGGAAAAGDGAEAQGESSNPATPGRARKSGAFDGVIFGKQDTPAADAEPQKQSDTIVSSNTLDEKRKAFQDLISGEYKDQATEWFQTTFDRRFKDYKTLKGERDAQKEIIDTLTGKYGITDGDLKKLKASIEDDDAFWADAADEAGMSVEQYKKFVKLQRENKAMQEERQREVEDKVNQQRAEKWYKEFEELRSKIPGLDPGKELEDQNFVRMLQSGVPVEAAYNAIHIDEIMNGVASAASARAEKRVSDNIRARGARPAENAASSRAAATIKDDVSKLTKAEREEVVRRARMGEIIRF